MYYQDESQAIYSISIGSGDIQWKYSPEFTKRFTFSTPAMDTCCIYALIGDRKQGGIVKLNRHSGSKIAFFPVGQLGFMSSVSLADGVVFFGDDGEGTRGSHGHMNAIDIQNGKLIWRFETGGFVRGTASIAGSTVYFGSADHYMYAVNRYTGEMKWRYKTDGIVNSTPAIVNGRLYFGSIDGHLYVLE